MKYIFRLVFSFVLSIILSSLVFARSNLNDTAGYPALETGSGTIFGIITDRETGKPVVFATVRLKDTGRYRISRSDGSFQFDDLPARRFIITVEHIGYTPEEILADLRDADTVFIEIDLRPSVFELSGSVIVTGVGRERGVADTYQPTEVLGGLELQRRLQGNLSATLLHIPGISQQYFGSAASQPVIRGMGGDRMLILEDGQRTGDLSTTAADHAVTVEPLTAERIEIVRGPAGLIYGSNALGGVINVIREEVPRSVPRSVSGTITAGGESVYNGLNGGVALLVPLGSFVMRAEAGGRKAGDIRTPLGKLPSTDLEGYTAGGGLSLVRGVGVCGCCIPPVGNELWCPGGI
jgi:iron complex outermembrane recepter protein